MVGGGGFGWEPGEWTDDTAMAIAIAEVAATEKDLRDESAQDAIVVRWHDWAQSGRKTLVCRLARSLSPPVATASPPRGRAPNRKTAPPHRPHRRQRLADAHRARCTGLPRRRGRAGRGRPRDQRAHALRSRRRRRLCALVLRDPARGLHRSTRRTLRTEHIDPHGGGCGRHAWTRPSRHGHPTSPTTDGWWPRCRPPGRRSRPPPGPQPGEPITSDSASGAAMWWYGRDHRAWRQARLV